jgi:hypothetical protein
VTRANQLDAILDERMRHLEICGAEQTETAPRTIAGKVAPDDRSDRWIPAHCHAYDLVASAKTPSNTRP